MHYVHPGNNATEENTLQSQILYQVVSRSTDSMYCSLLVPSQKMQRVTHPFRLDTLSFSFTYRDSLADGCMLQVAGILHVPVLQ
jgi:hypothetical protein